MIKIVDDNIDEQSLLQAIKSSCCGAAILFVGTTRRVTNGRVTKTLHYEAYREMAFSELNKLKGEAISKFGLEDCGIVHRLGEVPLGESSIAVAVSSPHRKHAFEAVAWIMDQVKQHVPIWKQEVWEDGSTEWVHPDANGVATKGGSQ